MSEQLFIKLMMMTTSTHDGEVLTAIRKANAILAGQNLNWEEFIMQMASAPAQAAPVTPSDNWNDVTAQKNGRANTYGGPGVEQMMSRLMESVTGSFKEFIESVGDFYTIRGYITQRQYEALKKAYDMRKGR